MDEDCSEQVCVAGFCVNPGRRDALPTDRGLDPDAADASQVRDAEEGPPEDAASEPPEGGQLPPADRGLADAGPDAAPDAAPDASLAFDAGEACGEQGEQRRCELEDEACGVAHEVCVDGHWSECVFGDAQPETCEGTDEDCNGVIDDVAPLSASGQVAERAGDSTLVHTGASTLVAWSILGEGIKISARGLDGLAAGAVYSAVMAPAINPHLAYAHGQASLVFTSNGSLQALSIDQATGQPGVGAVQLDPGHTAVHPAAAALGADRLAAWGRNQSREVCLARLREGAQPNCLPSGGPIGGVSVASNGADLIVVAWSAGSGAASRIRYATFNARTFETEGPLPAGPEDVKATRPVAAGGLGGLAIAWLADGGLAGEGDIGFLHLGDEPQRIATEGRATAPAATAVGAGFLLVWPEGRGANTPLVGKRIPSARAAQVLPIDGRHLTLPSLAPLGEQTAMVWSEILGAGSSPLMVGVGPFLCP